MAGLPKAWNTIQYYRQKNKTRDSHVRALAFVAIYTNENMYYSYIWLCMHIFEIVYIVLMFFCNVNNKTICIFTQYSFFFPIFVRYNNTSDEKNSGTKFLWPHNCKYNQANTSVQVSVFYLSPHLETKHWFIQDSVARFWVIPRSRKNDGYWKREKIILLYIESEDKIFQIFESSSVSSTFFLGLPFSSLSRKSLVYKLNQRRRGGKVFL